MPQRTLGRLICYVTIYSVAFFLGLVAAEARSRPGALPPVSYMTQGEVAFRHGAFAEAVFNWHAAARAYERLGQQQEYGRALLFLARAYQALGQYQQTLQHLSTALSLAEQGSHDQQSAAILQSLGHVYMVLDQREKAAEHLQQGLRLAKQAGDTALTASVLNDLGNLFTAQAQYDDAQAAYAESVTLAQQADKHLVAVHALTNAAAAALQDGKSEAARAQLDRAAEHLRFLNDSHDKAYGWLKIGLTYNDVRTALPKDREALVLQAAAVFQDAARVAQALDDARAMSYAWGYLGALYEEEQRYQEALQLTRQARFAAQRIHAPESLYRWQWQAGRLHYALGDLDTAVASYRRSVETLQSFRQEQAPRYPSRQRSFRDSVGPLYFGLVDLLLQRAAASQDRTHIERQLREAQEAVERFKTVELREYFQDSCVDAARSRSTRLDEVVSQTTAIIYPIMLPDRLELLMQLPTGLRRVAVPVDAATLTKEVRTLRQALEKRTTRQYRRPAQKLYDWIIRPLESELAPFQIDTLVFVPDGPLRTIPMAVLHDGKVFLISKYALATTPGLNLTDPRPLPRTKMRILMAALTESTQGFPPLPHVAPELENIQALYEGAVLLNEDFRIANVEQQLGDAPVTIVHIASHGQFASTVEETFLLAFDEKLTMDRLSALIGSLRYRDEPIELLTLSACQTAAGDDRAALGLAGVAIKAGARSALATLWSINDQASADLVSAFYKNLQKPSLSRAKALQQAQVQLLQERRYRHPYYWSPFLLLNNWL